MPTGIGDHRAAKGVILRPLCVRVHQQGRTPDYGDAVTRALERVRLKYLAELAPFSPHDLRRSAATGAAEYLDAPERLIELMLNHVPKDRLIRTYQVGGMAEKLRELFLRWGDFIQTLTQPEQAKPDNVVSISFKAKQ